MVTPVAARVLGSVISAAGFHGCRRGSGRRASQKPAVLSDLTASEPLFSSKCSPCCCSPLTDVQSSGKVYANIVASVLTAALEKSFRRSFLHLLHSSRAYI